MPKEHGGLCLTRREGEGLTFKKDGQVIGRMTADETSANRVKLVLDFDSDIEIFRDELLEDE